MENKFSPSGAYSAMVTPFKKGNISEEGLKDIIDFLISHKADGVFPVSNVGEFLLLSQDEKKFIIKTICEYTNKKIKVIPGVSDVSLDNALDLCDYCYNCGADGVVVSAPYYYPYTQDYIKEFLLNVVNYSKLPVIIYNSPNFANEINFEALMELVEHPNVVAIKESSGDVKNLIKIMTTINDRKIDVNVLLGWEELLFTGLTYGATGCITSCGGIVPEILQKIIKCFSKQDYAGAASCEQSIIRIVQEISKYGFPYGYKMGVLARGLEFDICKSQKLDKLGLSLKSSVLGITNVIEKELILQNLF